MINSFALTPPWKVSGNGSVSIENGELHTEIPIAKWTPKYRAELSLNTSGYIVEHGKEYTVEFELWAEPDSFDWAENSGSIFFQLHTSFIGGNLNPPLALRLHEGKIKLDIKYDSRFPGTGWSRDDGYEVSETIDLGDWILGQWLKISLSFRLGKNGFAQSALNSGDRHSLFWGLGFGLDTCYLKMGNYSSNLSKKRHREDSLSYGVTVKRLKHRNFVFKEGIAGDLPQTDPSTSEQLEALKTQVLDALDKMSELVEVTRKLIS